jgi:Cu+-exporting ATPase
MTGTNTDVLIGNAALLEENAVIVPKDVLGTISTWSEAARSIVLVATRMNASSCEQPYRLRALLATADPIRPEAPGIIKELQHSHNISIYMLTGDNLATATAVGKQVGIPPSHIIAGVLPEQKAEKVRWLQENHSSTSLNRSSLFSRLTQSETRKNRRATVAFIGDGTNDAPALSAADVSIAMSHSSGSDVAVSTASFVLLSSDLNTLFTLLKLSKTVMRRIMFNFGWALVYNCVGVPVAAGAFYAIRTAGGGHVRLDPVWAALAMALSSVSVVGSSLLMRTGLPVVGFRT